jgi:signal transduction histidine kinase
MRFIGELPPAIQNRVEACDRVLNDPGRLNALNRTGLIDSPREEAFDRLARMAARILKVNLTIVSLVNDKKQFFKAFHGIPSPLDIVREIPLDGSICRYTLRGEPIIVADSSVDPLLMHHPATRPWDIAAFLSLPITTSEGHVLGAFCAVDSTPRIWSEEDIYVMQELTASVMTEITLRERIRELEKQRDLREKFVSVLTHDLRTPMSAAKMSAQMILKRPENLEKVKLHAGRIIRSVDRADQMVQDLLDANRIRAGEGLTLRIVPSDLADLADITLQEMNATFGKRFHLQRSGNTQGTFDPTYFRRVIENLCNNAIKYGEELTPITVSVIGENERLVLSVHNEGNPLCLADQANLFDTFHRTESAKANVQLGWGLGLTLVRGVAEAHDGTATVKSEAFHGTVFTVNIPRIHHQLPSLRHFDQTTALIS